MKDENEKLKEFITKENNETNSHIELVKTDLVNTIEGIEIPEAILEEKEAKKALKIVTGIDKKLTSYIDSEMKEKDKESEGKMSELQQKIDEMEEAFEEME